MRKYTIITFIICFFSAFSICRAETVEFLIENSPYYVHKDLIIEKGQRFTAEPGVVIEVARGAGKTSIQPFLKQPLDFKDAGVDLRE